MKKIFAAALLVSSIAGIGFASAMTAAPSISQADTEIIQVAQGCGPGYSRGAYGRCRPNRVVVVRPFRPVIVAPVVRRCPPGQGMTRFGCRRR